ncbi:hypothetical protein WISP_79333 [Willisornis vidua]|uniref:Uncharacterized protein n=1 Tax=Willisornis vidua TaxID=1566151 RepID=A0ABQ9D5A5_9PASS|nr:hypothetical protein WISP_79333 [Willisornis vidua]
MLGSVLVWYRDRAQPCDREQDQRGAALPWNQERHQHRWRDHGRGLMLVSALLGSALASPACPWTLHCRRTGTSTGTICTGPGDCTFGIKARVSISPWGWAALHWDWWSQSPAMLACRFSPQCSGVRNCKVLVHYTTSPQSGLDTLLGPGLGPAPPALTQTLHHQDQQCSPSALGQTLPCAGWEQAQQLTAGSSSSATKTALQEKWLT